MTEQTTTPPPDPSEVWCPPLAPVVEGGLARPRIGIAGISIESSTFSPHISGTEAFTVRRGVDLLAYYPFLDEGRELRSAAEWVPLMHARSLPGGAVDPELYVAFRDEIIDQIRNAGPLDALFFDIHGAMSVVGMQDAEGDLARHVRQALGDAALVSASMDLHGNVSFELLENVDLITCYRMAPHEDAMNTKERAVFNLLGRLRAATGADVHKRRPSKAWLPVPVLLPGEKTSTRIKPAKGIYEEIPAVTELDGVLDAAIWVGYAWADEPRCQAYVVVTGDDVMVIRREAERLGRMYWDARRDFAFVAETATLEEGIAVAIAPDAPRPYFLSDTGDNPTAGGAGDVTWTLAQLLASEPLAAADVRLVHASIFDAEAVEQAVAAGVGGAVDMEAGARIDHNAHGPVRLHGTVYSITDGDPVAGMQAVVKVGNVFAILTERRKPFHHISDFTCLGLDPAEFDVVVVKIGYLEPELFDAAAGWKLALTPGGVDQDLLRLGHSHLADGVFPFSEDGGAPALTATVHRR
ncbi:M81 family metallopeptidase [Paenarthrobacter sp. PH39-S1]|uniref:M81 family metallopeptidase n=1 Tax=Paenarthrobacter sp. PH39-S1 TaxID=3046204 RepID=UPI0024B8F79C|nr:M81 family metallopeptidase [Paenarthrobacter sp. PH39-S1]MDJ0358161.1 M81 family metallopeptidase [Paenarthrobacter sp. PH39-S1]